MSKKTSPFYCYKKMCRKTAWGTPEYMSEVDWAFLQKARDIIAAKNVDDFWALQFDDPTMWTSFFNHMLGWPEGENYCRDFGFVSKSFIPAMGQNELPKIDLALAARKVEQANQRSA